MLSRKALMMIHLTMMKMPFTPYYLYIYWSALIWQYNVVRTGKKKCLNYLVGNLVATNWPIEKALHAIGYNQIPTK